jgi:hypothetical protein
MDSILDAELAWTAFCKDVVSMDNSSNDMLRYVRINPDIGREPPRMDEVKDMGRLIQDARRALKGSKARAEITRVTHILVASSFYYERTSEPVLGADGLFSCAGKTYGKRASPNRSDCGSTQVRFAANLRTTHLTSRG